VDTIITLASGTEITRGAALADLDRAASYLAQFADDDAQGHAADLNAVRDLVAHESTSTTSTALIHDEPRVDAEGFIVFAGERLDHAEAIKLAYRLTQAVEDSIWRTQKNQSWYHDTARINARADAPLGQAKKALSKVFGLRFENGRLV
jgi:hypothetical protein